MDERVEFCEKYLTESKNLNKKIEELYEEEARIERLKAEALKQRNDLDKMWKEATTVVVNPDCKIATSVGEGFNLITKNCVNKPSERTCSRNDIITRILADIDASSEFKKSLGEFKGFTRNEGEVIYTNSRGSSTVRQFDHSWKLHETSTELSKDMEGRKVAAIQFRDKFCGGSHVGEVMLPLMRIVFKYFTVEDVEACPNLGFFKNALKRIKKFQGDLTDVVNGDFGNNTAMFGNYIRMLKALGLEELVNQMTVYVRKGKTCSKKKHANKY